MNQQLILVHTQADKKTTAYVEFMWETMKSLAQAPDLLRLHVHCLGPKAVEILSTLEGCETHLIDAGQGGSYGHGACIMNAFKFTDDGNIHVICDGDALVAAKGWDSYVRRRIAEGVGMMGTTYEDLGGFSSGNDHVQTYKKLPTFTWAVINSNYDWKSLDVMPNKDHRVKIDTAKLSTMYNLPIGYSVFGEAAWQIPRFIHDTAMPNEGWRQLKPSKEAIVLKGLTDYHEEFHVGGVPFIVHHRGSIKHAYRGNKVSNAFFKAVDDYLEKEKQRGFRWDYTVYSNSDTMFQLSFPFGTPGGPIVTKKEQRSEVVQAPDVLDAKGWIKISVDGHVTRARGNIDQPTHRLVYDSDLGKTNLARFEGTFEGTFGVNIPKATKPHCLLVRNATNSAINMMYDDGNLGLMNPGAVQMFLVDVDAVIPVS